MRYTCLPWSTWRTDTLSLKIYDPKREQRAGTSSVRIARKSGLRIIALRKLNVK